MRNESSVVGLCLTAATTDSKSVADTPLRVAKRLRCSRAVSKVNKESNCGQYLHTHTKSAVLSCALLCYPHIALLLYCALSKPSALLSILGVGARRVHFRVIVTTGTALYENAS